MTAPSVMRSHGGRRIWIIVIALLLIVAGVVCVFVSSVTFLSSQESQNGNNFPHIYVHTPLQNLTAAAIRKLDGLADEAQFEAQIGSIPEKDIPSKIEMDKILWVCSSLFTEAYEETTTTTTTISLHYALLSRGSPMAYECSP